MALSSPHRLLLFQKHILAKLFHLALPMIGLNLLNALSLAVDTAMCGRLPQSEQVLTALGFATQVIFFMMIGMLGITVGTVAMISRAYGANDSEKIKEVLEQSMLLTAGISMLIATLGSVWAPWLLATLGAPPEALDLSMEYLYPLLIGSLFNNTYILLSAVLRGIGNTRLPFVISFFANLVNVFLNYGLILGHWGFPALGILGASLGTLGSYIFGTLVLMIVLKGNGVPPINPPFFPNFRHFKWKMTQKLFSIGFPASLDLLILNVSFFSIVGFLGHLDPRAVAAHGIGLRIQALAIVPGIAISQAAGALIGQALGKENVLEAKQVLWSALSISMIMMTALASVIWTSVDALMALFDVNQGTVLADLTRTWIHLLSFGMPILGIHLSFVGLLQGSGSTKISLGINLISTLLIQVPLSALLGFKTSLGITGIWLAFPLTFIIRALLDIGAYHWGRWAKVGTF